MAAEYPTRPTTPARHVRSHTGRVVHRGTWVKAPHTLKSDGWATPGWITAQACGNSHRAIAYGHPTDEAATCKRCGPAPALQPCRWCESTDADCAAWAATPRGIKCCPDCDHRAGQEETPEPRPEPAGHLDGVLDVATDPSALF